MNDEAVIGYVNLIELLKSGIKIQRSQVKEQMLLIDISK